MGKKRTRHSKGSNKGDGKRQRAEREEKWKATRGDESGHCTPPQNEKFDAFYRVQLFPEHAEEDWTSFSRSIRSSLPACFRINPNYEFSNEMRNELLQYAIIPQEEGSAEIEAVKPLSWCAGAYQLGMDRKTIRKSAGMEKLHQWLIQHTNSGNITRQEAVSMVPPLALNVHSSHRILDMCAAPGSKTSQLLEVLQQNNDVNTAGVVVANDADTDRAYMLVHQCRRINSPHLIVTTHMGQVFPTIRTPSDRTGGHFDRVLCDAPCSGDGTLRKSPNIWGKWSTSSGFTLHPLQLSIAKRGLALLKEGGLMVYSTCSLSPYEDEAVVAELLRYFGKDKLEIIDARTFLPNFKCRPGLQTWHVLDDAPGKDKSAEPRNGDEDRGNSASDPLVSACESLGMKCYATFNDVPPHRQHRIRSSCFPPTREESEWMHLERCLRCLPHDEDTGGFFVTTFRKIPSVITSTTEATEPVAEVTGISEENDEVPSEPKKSNSKRPQLLVNFKQWDNDAYTAAASFYGLTGVDNNSFYIREDNMGGNNGEGGQSKAVYYIPPAVREVLAAAPESNLKVVAAGIKVFEKKTKGAKTSCDFRLSQDGVHMLAPFVTARRVSVTVQDFCNLLGGGMVSFSTLSPGAVLALSPMPIGSLLCSYSYSPEDRVVTSLAPSDAQHTFHMVCWRGATRAINVMCNKTDIEAIRHQMESLGVMRDRINAVREPTSSVVTADVVVEDDENDTKIVTEESLA